MGESQFESNFRCRRRRGWSVQRRVGSNRGACVSVVGVSEQLVGEVEKKFERSSIFSPASIDRDLAKWQQVSSGWAR